ncbi:armadillo-type protein [Halteromyces radiatus]|uniref:armadillo-type protein n=1 Tax=Halteromyces radiatus TaxID=101107 RepID=UPI002220912D|nr:armadillo-type protein [Halteromyces radiatus]KAI8092520.1 armadillo-type protein [Halteromyces radiatus]
MDVPTLLSNTLSPDRTIREDAVQKLELFAQEDYPSYVLMLCQVLANEQITDDIRQAAALALKNSLSAKEFARREEQALRWLAVDENSKAQIKQAVLLTLASPKKTAGQGASQVIAAIAEIELPRAQWQDLIHVLLDNVTNTDNANLKQATLKTIGFVCESVHPNVLSSQSNEILTAVVQGARKEEQNNEVRLEATKALYNSLEFIKDNFEREGERNFIMQVVCEATQSESSEIKVSAYECLVRIMQLYYYMMHFYMEKALFGLTVSGMNDPEEKVALQAIEFWSTVCDVEMEVKEEMADAHEVGEEPDRVCYNFAGQALNDIVPVLLWLLTKQEEDEDEDEWNVSMASATCLALLAQCVHNAVITPIVPFVDSNIRNNDWRYREAAVMAFGSILDGPDVDVLKPLVDQALPTLITMMQDPVVNVKDTVAWTLGRVCELLPTCIKPDIHLHELVSSLLRGLQDNPRIVGNCCWSLMNLAEQLGNSPGLEEPTSVMSAYFEGIVTALLQFTERSDNEANCRTSAYEAVSSLIMFSANDCIPMVQKVVLAILDRLEAAIAMENQILDADDRAEHSELQSSLLGVLTNSIRRLPQDIFNVSDRIMTVVLQLLNTSSKQATTTEDAFLTIGAMTTVLEADFIRYADTFVPILCAALQNPQEYQLCLIAVGIIGDICRALGQAAAPYCNEFMQLLVSNLQSPILHRSVKPCILSCFGDIALAIGEKFEPYLEVVIMVLQQAGQMRATSDNYEMIDYVNSLLEGNVEAYVGIVQGMSNTPNVQVLLPHMDSIFQFISSLSYDQNRSDDLTRALIGLVGDLAETFGGHIKIYLSNEWVAKLLKDGRIGRHTTKATKDTSRWAKEMVKQACQ